MLQFLLQVHRKKIPLNSTDEVDAKITLEMSEMPFFFLE